MATKNWVMMANNSSQKGLTLLLSQFTKLSKVKNSLILPVTHPDVGSYGCFHLRVSSLLAEA
jgi:hypothetical protein